MKPRRPVGGSVLLLAELSSDADVDAADGLPMSWHADAVVIAATRAAVAKGLGVLMLPDDHFAPLVADVLAEYTRPRMAEGQTREQGEAADSMGTGSLSFVTLTRARSRAGGRLGRAQLVEMRPMIDLGVVDEAVHSLKDQAIRVVLVVGGGSNVDRALRDRAVANIRRYHFLRPGGGELPAEPPSDAVRQEFEAKLTAARQEIRHYVPRFDDRPASLEPREPLDFWKYPDYPLFTEFVLDRMA